MILAAALVLALAAFFGVLSVLVWRGERKLSVLRRLERDLLRGEEKETGVFDLLGIGRLVERERVRLAGTGLGLRPEDLILLKLGTALAALVGGAVSGWPVLGIGGAVLAVRGIDFTLDRLRAARVRRIEAALCPALAGLAALLRVQPSVEAALRAALEDVAEPLRRELRQVLRDLEGGKLIEEALENFADRCGSPLVRAWADSVAFAARAGTGLAEACLRVAAKIRERQRVAREIRAAAAGAKTTAGGIAAVLGLSVFGMAASGQLAEVAAWAWGRTLLGLAVLAMAAATFWIWAIIEREVES